MLSPGPLADWPRDVRRLLDPSARHASAEGVSEEWLLPASEGLHLLAASFQIPHPRKAATGGEDSFFVSSDHSAAGVADGVGEWGWRFKLNPRAFADEVMTGACSRVESLTNEPELAAKDIAAFALCEGFAGSKSYGSATALVASLDTTAAELGVANLGDSGLRQVRHLQDPASCLASTRIVGRTKEQQHSFNFPFQLARLPEPEDFPRLLAEGQGSLVRAVKNAPPQDQPADADLYTFSVKEGDLIILGTDGVFDNLHDHEICQLAECTVSPFEAQQALDLKSGKLMSPGSSSTDPAKVAEAIAQAAFYRSRDKSARTPFTVNAKEAGRSHFGGKSDDITVVAAWVVRTCSM